MIPVLSIIVPCYNSELTLEETLQSILDQSFSNWEAIIINDGSFDSTEEIALTWRKKDNRFKYFFKENEGLGKARNFGIKKSGGSFILPLDSDNLIFPNFAEKALEIFKNNAEVGVVHGNAELIGEKSGIWKIPKYNFQEMLVVNYIDACAIYRKSLWQEVGGYDEHMPHQGNEDWDLWLAFGALGVQFYHLDIVTFNYRISSNSMLRSYTPKIIKDNEDYIFKKYRKYRRINFKRKFDHFYDRIIKELKRIILKNN